MATSLWKRLLWQIKLIRFAFTAKPVQGGSPEGDPPKEDPPKEDPPKEDPPKEDPPKDDPDKIDPEDDWKAKARKHERAAKREREAKEEAERKLQEREDADKSDQEKAIDQARKEAREEALTEADKDRRADRLEAAVTRLASKGITVEREKDGKTTEESVRFADSEDALLRIQRMIDRDDLGDVFDDEGKVNTEALTEALAGIAKANPHLVGGEGRKPAGDADSRKGDAAQQDLESMSPADHEKRKYAGANK